MEWKKRTIYAFDLDGTLCTGKPREWECEPIRERIEEVNKLYKQWHVILIYTARYPEYFSDTLAWLIKFWVHHHGINMRTKPGADIYIDDKAISAGEFFIRRNLAVNMV